MNANARKNQKRQDEERKKIERTTWNVIIILFVQDIVICLILHEEDNSFEVG
jgi:hypothetical protein